MKDCPLSSSAPRAQMWPSRTSGSKGLLFPEFQRFGGHYVVVCVYQYGFGFRVYNLLSEYEWGLPADGITSASSAPAASSSCAQRSAQASMSSWCSGLALMLGIRIRLNSSSSIPVLQKDHHGRLMSRKGLNAFFGRNRSSSFHTGDDHALGISGSVYSRFKALAAPQNALTPGQ